MLKNGSEEIRAIKHGIMDTIDTKMNIDHETDQSSHEKTLLGLSSLVFQTGFLSKVRILDDLVQG